jgi:hypothetical protein
LGSAGSWQLATGNWFMQLPVKSNPFTDHWFWVLLAAGNWQLVYAVASKIKPVH